MHDAYAAGLLDGEGTVTMTRNKATEWRAPIVSMASTTPELLQFMVAQYGGSVSTKTRTREQHKQSWSWKVTNDAALDALTKMLPYLREPEKRRRAELLTTRYKAVTLRNGKYTPEQAAEKARLEAEFFATV